VAGSDQGGGFQAWEKAKVEGSHQKIDRKQQESVTIRISRWYPWHVVFYYLLCLHRVKVKSTNVGFDSKHTCLLIARAYL
jgi:hypothetical protein